MTAVKIGVLAVAALGVCSIFGNTNPKIDSISPNVHKAMVAAKNERAPN